APALSGWFEQLDRVSVRILDLHLASGRPGLHVVSETDPHPLHFGDARWKIGDLQHDAVPTTWLLSFTVRRRTRARSAGPTQEDVSVTKGHSRKLGEVLVF